MSGIGVRCLSVLASVAIALPASATEVLPSAKRVAVPRTAVADVLKKISTVSECPPQDKFDRV